MFILLLDAHGVFLAAVFLFILIGLPGLAVVYFIVRHQSEQQRLKDAELERQRQHQQRLLERQRQEEARKQYLFNKYNNPALVERILSRDIRQGDSKDIVTDALGTPASIDTDVLKTKTKEVWKYRKGNEKRVNQHNIIVKFENSVVVGWEDKNE